jgi:hypothetical protein
MNTPDLHQLALELEAHGFVGHDTAINSLSRSARAAGLSPVLIDVLGDPQAPEVARLRAFGTIASRLGQQAAPARSAARPPRRGFRRRSGATPRPVAPAA